MALAVAAASFAASPPTLTRATASGRRLSSPISLGMPQLPPRLPFDKHFFPAELCAKNVAQLARAFPPDEKTTSFEVEEVFADLKDKWDAIDDKTSLLVYGTGAVVAVWLSSVIVNAISSVPLLPSLMEAVGIGYTGWFIYRYLLFKSSRKELANEIEVLKDRITGSE
ncbi:hypothetical protein SAY86_017468 [Trapa natans]|uniref:Cyanobacterial aminoacyl-tRNA synthetase CAAD domain-containing protein n=1 Tax=Trapa natans TaxID=22666 RepID=A0AAN7LRD3_TRANT|nr:hypothetical protein SAY86_017468 [Trapa natans]